MTNKTFQSNQFVLTQRIDMNDNLNLHNYMSVLYCTML